MKKLNVYIAVVLMIFSYSFGYAQKNDSISCKQTEKIVGIVLPSALIAYGVISLGDNGVRNLDYSVRDHLIAKNALWNQHWDDYMTYSPAVAAFGLKIGGMPSAHKTIDMAILYALSNLLNVGMAEGTKRMIARERPDYSDRQSFPSGHTSRAFVAAEFLHQEYKDQSIWISVGGYGMASLIGVSRVYNNRHWVSDVIAGAGVGILSTKIVYWAYPRLQEVVGKSRKKTHTLLFPSYSEGAWGIHLSCTF
ncbi:MAG: phosphatase PAP2 family protein [Dysgonamonadaceae bacterium]|jgi:membrane-associated phospholipid phosphatase|nr:phosphatase PAP2 family protein [Dysgonamonadaceae bacterium]